VNKLDNFGAFHNFHFGSSGIQARKAYGIGPGKLFPYKPLYVKHQGPTMLQTEGNDAKHWFDSVKERDLNPERKKQPTASESLFECSVAGCAQAFALFSELESHLNVGQHTGTQATSESFYDKVRKDWAGKFASVDVASQTKCYATSTLATSTSLATSSSSAVNDTPLTMGWAINKTTSSTRFPQKVKEYLTARFLIGEKTGCKADPNQVEKDMRTSRNPSNERKFNCKEWLTKTQIKGFFSRLAASRRKENGLVGMSLECEEDVECLVRDSERQELIESITHELGLKHPITFDTYDLCEYYHSKKLSNFNVPMLKNILCHLEVNFKSKDKKQILVDKLKNVISQCECDVMHYE
jgi:Arf-GAP/Rho-GAP domain/ANK repeat/PH domain-containing protein 3